MFRQRQSRRGTTIGLALAILSGCEKSLTLIEPEIHHPYASPLGAPVVFSYCKDTSEPLQLYVDEYRIAEMGHNRRSGCFQTIHPEFNTKGLRNVTVRTYEGLIRASSTLHIVSYQPE